MTESHDDVSKIHKRYSLTLLTPSSSYHSLIFSVIAASILCVITLFLYLERPDDLVYRLPPLIAVLLATQYLDSRFIKNKEYSKALHLSLFGNLMWVGITLSGIAASVVLSKQDLSAFYVAGGMIIFASFRIGIFTTTLGTSMKRAWALCFVQPLAMYIVLMPQDFLASSILNQNVLGIGAAFLAIATVWSFATDRAGRPSVESTHKLVQAYLASRSKGNFDEVESIIASRSKPSSVITSQIRIYSKGNDFRMVLPEIHPGPYHPIGGSNITYAIYKTMNSSAMVMHSISDHALN
ncbi:MAG: DUF2070 family protein, partial [Candidatus Nitrosotenuis sp.]